MRKAAAGNQLRIIGKNISWNTNCLAVSEGQPFAEMRVPRLGTNYFRVIVEGESA